MSEQQIKQWLSLSCLILFFGVILFAATKNELGNYSIAEQASIISHVTPTQVEQTKNLIYGIEQGDLKPLHETISSKDLIGNILLRHGISNNALNKMLEISKDVFDVRRIRPGKKYCVLTEGDSAQTCRYFIYEKNPIDFVVLSFGEKLEAFERRKEVTTELKTAAGVINSSLYLTLAENNISPALAVKLSEIYAWSIDFYRIQKGDFFKVIYEETYADGEYVGLGDIKALQFNHHGEDFYGFEFEQDGKISYYDENGLSLRKAFLKAPLKFSRISSKFTPKRFHPVQKRWKAHLGTDYAAPTGTPIMTVGDGVIVEAGYSKYNGNYVKVKHNGTYTTQYLHMSKIGAGIKAGKAVKQSDVIGYVGSTGLATGPHVCFRFWKNGKQVDPFQQKIPPSHPVKAEHKSAYAKVMADYKRQLQNVQVEMQALAKTN